MKQQYAGLGLTAHNRLTGDNNLVKQMNEHWERILKATKEEFEKTQTNIQLVLEEERMKITLIKGIRVF